jgi:NAD(P)-dependent dehydrogenase (short-subunit alcohol dehydrogenase family)
LINNAGQAAAGSVATVDPEHYRAIIDLNLFGPLYAMQAVVPVMKAQPEGGVIINISSNVSKMAIPGIGAYASTKYALNGLSYTARAELAPDNIRVIVFCPGLTATDFGKNALRRESGDGPQRQNSHMVPDSVVDVAQKILEAARTEPAELGMPISPPTPAQRKA